MSGEVGTYPPSADAVTAEEIKTKELLVYLTKTLPTDAFAQKNREAYERFASYVLHTGLVAVQQLSQLGQRAVCC